VPLPPTRVPAARTTTCPRQQRAAPPQRHSHPAPTSHETTIPRTHNPSHETAIPITHNRTNLVVVAQGRVQQLGLGPRRGRLGAQGEFQATTVGVVQLAQLVTRAGVEHGDGEETDEQQEVRLKWLSHDFSDFLKHGWRAVWLDHGDLHLLLGRQLATIASRSAVPPPGRYGNSRNLFLFIPAVDCFLRSLYLLLSLEQILIPFL
jgi:hypothetical protein